MLVGSTLQNGTAAAALCITQAEDEIKKQLAKRYDVSDAAFQTAGSIPPMLQHIALWLSLGYFFQISSRGGPESMKRGKAFIDQAMTNLKEIASREADLVDSVGAPIAEASNYMAMTSTSKNYSPTFNEDDPLNWAVDSDKLDDIDSERS
jgi:hypothetical protein